MSKPELGIYVHIPFCMKKCSYCDFVSFANQEENHKKYIDRLIEEIKEEKTLLSKYQITTIYIGGGTPSIIDAEDIGLIINTIKKIANLANLEDLEITIEVNPGTVTKEKLQVYKKYGINRLSIGLQTTDDNLLQTIGRIHTYKDFKNVYKDAKDVGFKNINVDLMIGLPTQSIQDIKKSLEEVKELRPEHISIYSLIVEPGTKMSEWIEKKKFILPSEDEERAQYYYVKNTLELAGYEHYEISNFSLPSKQAKHNLNCWEQKQYVGFGVAAHSYINKKRYSNTNSLEEYFKKDFKEIKTVHEIQKVEDEEKEFMLLGLRKLEGIKISKFKEKFGKNPLFIFKNEINKLVEEELLEVDLNNIFLTRKGLDLANLVWEEFV